MLAVMWIGASPMTDYVRTRLRQTTHTTCGAVLTGAR